MKRRGFFGALFGAAAIPLVAKAGDAVDAIDDSSFSARVKQPGVIAAYAMPAPLDDGCYFTAYASCAAGVSVRGFSDYVEGEYDEDEDEDEDY